jgi:hypothetical protein
MARKHELMVGTARGGLSLISWLSEIADNHGFYAHEDLVVTSKPSSYGELDIGLQTGEPLVVRRGPDADLALAGRGATVRVVAGIVSSAVFDIVSYRRFNGLEALKDARIAVIHPRYGSTLALRIALRRAGLSENDYELVEIGSSPARLDALRTGRVDATILTLPYRDDDTDLFVVAETATVIDEFVASSIQANIEAVETSGKQDAVIAYLAATIRAARWLADHNNETAAIDWLQDKTACNAAMARRAYKLMHDGGLAIDCQIPANGLQIMLDELGRSGDICAPAPADEYVYDQYLQQARRRVDEREYR